MSSELVVQDDPQMAAQSNPLAMVAAAVQKGTDPATIKALMDLAERYEANEARKAFVQALAAFKADPPKIAKNKDVDFTSSKGRTHYRHATLDNVCDVIGAALAKHQLSYRWRTEQQENGLIRVGCILTHALGPSVKMWLQAGGDETSNKNSIQAVGSTVTYLQRYTLLSATGMAVAEQDDDGKQGKRTAMADKDKAGFLEMIEACETMAQAETLWSDIAKATTAAGDVAAHEELRAAMTARRRKLKSTAETTK